MSREQFNEKAVVLFQCPDRSGIVARISEYIHSNGANMVQADQYSTGDEDARFFMRVEFEFDRSVLGPERLHRDFSLIAAELDAEWQIHFRSSRLRMGIMVSKFDHCLNDLLYRWKSGELEVDIPFVISNHETLRADVEAAGIAFHCIPVEKGAKAAAEAAQLQLLHGQTDFLVLARYMQILSGDFIREYGRDIINIHHSFLPSFVGADPYRQAYLRGVKIIGATAHFVTEDLDEGPIIEQMVERVNHRYDVAGLKRLGRNLEQLALARAVHAQLEHRILRYRNKTVVFM